MVDGKQKHIGAHVFSYVLHYGPVPDGQEVMHGPCNNGLCVRPDHLSAGTHRMNVQDAARDGLYHVERPRRQKVTNAQVDLMVALRQSGLTLQAISERFGVTKAYVSFLVRGLRRQYRPSLVIEKAS
jgi:hypothetical protein